MSALIVVVSLPPAVAAFRQVHVPTAGQGVPPHVTLIYPFLEPELFDEAARDRVRSIVGRRPVFDFRLTRVEHWPGSTYLAVEPAEPFEGLVQDLVEAFPEFPPYAGQYRYVPHVSIAEDDPEVPLDGISADLAALVSAVHPAREVELIARISGEWLERETFPLGR